MSYPQTAQASFAMVTASGAVKATPGRILAVLVNGGTTATKVDFTNDADGNGTPVLTVEAPFSGAAIAGGGTFLDISKFGGVIFSAKIYAKITGTGASVAVWYE